MRRRPKKTIETPRFRVRQCRYGVMAYFPHDVYIGRSLELYGEFSEGEVDLYKNFVKKGDVVIEAGAHVGALTVPLARLVAAGRGRNHGRILAFEPQAPLYHLLKTNLTLNRLANAEAHRLALGEKMGRLGVPIVDYSRPGNFGGYSLKKAGPHVARVATIDSLRLPRLDFLKIDVEGMEVKVLMGARRTISRCQPVIYCENDRAKKSAGLIDCLKAMGYTMYWHLPPLYNKRNFRRRPTNVFGRTVSANMLCLPPGRKNTVRGLHRIT